MILDRLQPLSLSFLIPEEVRIDALKCSNATGSWCNGKSRGSQSEDLGSSSNPLPLVERSEAGHFQPLKNGFLVCKAGTVLRIKRNNGHGNVLLNLRSIRLQGGVLFPYEEGNIEEARDTIIATQNEITCHSAMNYEAPRQALLPVRLGRKRLSYARWLL